MPKKIPPEHYVDAFGGLKKDRRKGRDRRSRNPGDDGAESRRKRLRRREDREREDKEYRAMIDEALTELDAESPED